MDLTELELGLFPPCLLPVGCTWKQVLSSGSLSGHTLAVSCGGVLLVVLEEKKIKFRLVLKR